MSEVQHPTGWFPARVKENSVFTNEKGTTFVVVTWVTEHGEIADYMPLSEKAAYYTAKKLASIGFDGKSFSELADPERLKGLSGWIKVKAEEYNGQVTHRVSWVQGEEPTRNAEEAAKAASVFDNILKQAQKEVKLEEETKPQVRTGKKANDDDVPF